MSFSQTTITDISETIIALEKGALEKWNQGDPSGYLDLSADDVTYFDPSIEQRLDGLDNLKKYYELCSGKRPADELYDLSKDPYQLTNVAGNPEYKEVLKKLKDQLMRELRETEDPRVFGKGESFDNYPYFGEMKK